MKSRLTWVLALTIVAWALTIPAAHAYIDPGSTSFIFSALVAFLAAAGMTLKLFWRKLTRPFRRGEPTDQPASETTAGRPADEA